jgi:septum formation protein
VLSLPLGRRIILASASPRRADLLRQVGLEFEVCPADIDESLRDGEPPANYVARLSVQKASEVAITAPAGLPAIVIGADTTVEVDGEILGKPTDDHDARRMLDRLSAVPHRVRTGVTVMGSARAGATSRTIVVETTVVFVPLDEATIEWYVGTGEPMGKAGGYAIQGAGGALVERVDGSVTNVIGLPLAETLALVRRCLPAESD